MNIQVTMTRLAGILAVAALWCACTELPSYDPCSFHPENQKLCDSGIEGSNNNCVTEDHPHCPSGVCLSYQYSLPFCTEGCVLPICESDDDCTGGDKCVEGPNMKVCAKPCQADADCGSGSKCDTMSGSCTGDSVCERLGWDHAGCSGSGCCVRISVAGEGAVDGFCVKNSALYCAVESDLIGGDAADDYKKKVTDKCYQSDCRAGACCRSMGVGCTDPTDPSTCVHGCVKAE